MLIRFRYQNGFQIFFLYILSLDGFIFIVLCLSSFLVATIKSEEALTNKSYGRWGQEGDFNEEPTELVQFVRGNSEMVLL